MGPDMHWVMVCRPGAGTALSLVTCFPSMHAGSLTGRVFDTEDLANDVARLAWLGIIVANGIEEAPWEMFVPFDDSDPNGVVPQATAFAA